MRTISCESARCSFIVSTSKTVSSGFRTSELPSESIEKRFGRNCRPDVKRQFRTAAVALVKSVRD